MSARSAASIFRRKSMIELASCFLDRDLFLRMAKDYIDTLATYDNEILWDEVTWNGVIWNAQFIVEDRTIQGFAVTETQRFCFFPDAFYIAEFYIAPEARRKHIGTEAVKALTENWNGDLYLYVIDQNTPARFFWSNVEAELGWKRIKRPELRQEEGCELRVFSTKGGRRKRWMIP